VLDLDAEGVSMLLGAWGVPWRLAAGWAAHLAAHAFRQLKNATDDETRLQLMATIETHVKSFEDELQIAKVAPLVNGDQTSTPEHILHFAHPTSAPVLQGVVGGWLVGWLVAGLLGWLPGRGGQVGGQVGGRSGVGGGSTGGSL
jgi:hypothetical protein